MDFDKKGVGLHFGRFFSQTHPVTLHSTAEQNRMKQGGVFLPFERSTLPTTRGARNCFFIALKKRECLTQ
jgi:hypothetical protein